MELKELEELNDYNELDLLYKLIDIAKGSVRRAEQFIRGNKTAGVDVRHSMQDIRTLAELIRESIQIKKGTKKKGAIKLEKLIQNKKESLLKEEELIKKTENLRALKIREKNILDGKK